MISAFMARSKLRQILAMMEEERVILLNGPLSALAPLTAKRSLILEALEKGGPVSRAVLGDGLTQIRSLAIRNKKLFQASVAGMKAAAETLQDLERNIDGMQTYTSRGEKVLAAQPSVKKDHRV